jgi:rRNA-processing protein FCF1
VRANLRYDVMHTPHSSIICLTLATDAPALQIDLVKGMMDCLYAECKPCITECVMAELEKLGQKYRVALKIAKDPRIQKLTCSHKGTYADDCICERVTQHRCYIVATCDKDLRRRLRKVCRTLVACTREYSCILLSSHGLA